MRLNVKIAVVTSLAGLAIAGASAPAGAAPASPQLTGGYGCAARYYTNPAIPDDGVAQWEVPTVDLSEGSTGGCVEWLQTQINGSGDFGSVGVDGDFGPQTRAAVIEAQQSDSACGGVDGVVGPNTFSCLESLNY